MQKELLSAYIDGEQVNHELTEKLCQDAELQESWVNFHTIRSVMRQETNVFLGVDFTAKMESLIATEEIQMAKVTESQPLPQEVENSPFMPSKDVITTEQLEQKNKRIGAMLQSYELQRRVYADSMNLGQNQSNK